MSSSRPLFVVVGATGQQGGAIISHFLKQSPRTYRLRGITRNISSAKSQALAVQGVEMVQADLMDPSSLNAAFREAKYIFAYTDFAGALRTPEAKTLVDEGQAGDSAEAAGRIEFQQGKNVAEAAAATAGLEKLLWSNGFEAFGAAKGTVPDVHEMSWKGKVWEYIRSLPALQERASGIIFAIFHDSLVRFPDIMGWEKEGEGRYMLRMPPSADAKMPFIDMPASAGNWVEAVMRAPAGIVVGAVQGKMSLNEYLQGLRSRYGVEVRIEQVGVGEYAKGDESGELADVGRMFQWFGRFGYEDIPDALGAEDLGRMGYGVEMEDLRVAMEKLDWSAIL